MLQRISTASSPARPEAKTPKISLTLTQIQARLGQVAAGKGIASMPAGKMLDLINGAEVSSRLVDSLGLLLSKSEGDGQIAAALTPLLTQEGVNAASDFLAVKDLARWLGMQLNQAGGRVEGGEKQYSSLLLQLSQGQVSDRVKASLADALQNLRQSSSPVTPADERLQSLLQQMRQEVNGAQEPQFAKNLTEFALRLHQQLNDDAAHMMFQNPQIGARHQEEQSQHQRHARDENEKDEEGDKVTAGKGSKRGVMLSVLPSGQAAPAYEASDKQATSLIIGGASTSSPRSVNSGMSLYQGDSVFSYGLSVLFAFMQLLSDQANGSYANMQENSNISRDAQQNASVVDGILANAAAKGNSNATDYLPQDIMDYIEQNHLDISGICGYGSDGKWMWQSSGPYDQGQLTAIKGALDNVANRASDFISTAQLQLQKMMQTYNVCVSLINSLQTMLADMNKTIAQGIR
jgi:secreted effector protein SseB